MTDAIDLLTKCLECGAPMQRVGKKYICTSCTRTYHLEDYRKALLMREGSDAILAELVKCASEQGDVRPVVEKAIRYLRLGQYPGIRSLANGKVREDNYDV